MHQRRKLTREIADQIMQMPVSELAQHVMLKLVDVGLNVGYDEDGDVVANGTAEEWVHALAKFSRDFNGWKENDKQGS